MAIDMTGTLPQEFWPDQVRYDMNDMTGGNRLEEYSVTVSISYVDIRKFDMLDNVIEMATERLVRKMRANGYPDRCYDIQYFMSEDSTTACYRLTAKAMANSSYKWSRGSQVVANDIPGDTPVKMVQVREIRSANLPDGAVIVHRNIIIRETE